MTSTPGCLASTARSALPRAGSAKAPVGFCPRGVAAERVVERLGIEAAAVDPDGRDRQPEGVQEVGDPRPARVLDDYAVAGAKLRLQGALDRVERTARDGDVAVDPVAGEIRLGRGDELRQLRLD